MDNLNMRAQILPNIEMYGGDTLDWKLLLRDDDMEFLPYSFYNSHTFVLTVTPLKSSTGLLDPDVILEINGSARDLIDDDNAACVIFSFAESDTKTLRGKYVYQIEVRDSGGEVRIGQGSLLVKQNIHQEAVSV